MIWSADERMDYQDLFEIILTDIGYDIDYAILFTNNLFNNKQVIRLFSVEHVG